MVGKQMSLQLMSVSQSCLHQTVSKFNTHPTRKKRKNMSEFYSFIQKSIDRAERNAAVFGWIACSHRTYLS